jgi:deoxycytidine triphosphate deaminase
MILGSEALLALVRTQNLVEGLAERELENPEGAGFDLRLGELYRISGDAYLGVEERRTPDIEVVARYEEGRRTSFTILPGEFYLARTIESVNTPPDLTINFKPRTTTFRSGLFIRSGNVAPGYRGPLVFAVKNEGPCRVTLELGARVIHAQFYTVSGDSNLYRGQWQGGRVTTDGTEQQV